MAAGLAGGLCPTADAAGGLTLLTEQPLPMAVRDGGLAEVTVRAVPFALGSDALDAPTATALHAYLAAVATDCFLFAQAVGHVRPGPEVDGDTLAAHRLARARSEAVQAALLAAGLPAASITSVWDRQFSLREPRVTLWVFARPAGEDCAGSSLAGGGAQVAVFGGPTSTTPTRSSMADAEPAPGIHLPAVTTSSAGPLRVALTPRAVAPTSEVDAFRAGASSPPIDAAELEPAPGIHRPQLADEDAATSAQPLVLAADTAPQPSIAATPAAVAAEPQAGPVPPASSPSAAVAASAEASSVQIVFAPDSSFFSHDAEAELTGLLAALPRTAAIEVELQAAVGDAAGRLSGDRALAYNQWLAERRQSRVEDWLGTRAEGPVLRVRRSLLAHDPSRRLVIRTRALP